MPYEDLLKQQIFISISEFTLNLKTLLEKTYQRVYLVGEISNLVKHSSGHNYFSLKDNKASIRAILFKRAAEKVPFKIENGLKVRVIGDISVYMVRGEYQIIIKKLEPDGMGPLQLAFEQLKQELAEKGYFDQKYKKKLPEYPKTIGVITSKTGAVIQDILNVLNRRFSGGLNILVFPTKVQGDGAKEEIVNAIKKAQKMNYIDVLILARGGGSIEDLWAFNEKDVAKAIMKSNIPIISAIGHEVDWTIADYVADLRAPTPSAAAEIVIQSKDASLNLIAQKQIQLYQYIERKIAQYKEKMRNYNLNSFQRLFLKNLDMKKIHLDHISKMFFDKTNTFYNEKKNKIEKIQAELKNLNPEVILKMGYSLSYYFDKKTKERKIIETPEELSLGDQIFLDFAEFNLELKLEKILKKKLL